MAVLVLADVPNQTREKYDGMLAALGDKIRQAKGFIAHGGHPTDHGWACFEIWESSEDATRFFAEHVHPNLPPGIVPKRSVVTLHSLIRSEMTADV